MNSIGTKIKTLRKERKMTQAELAKIINITEQAISMYERDVRKPSFEYLAKIAEVFNVPVSYFADDKLNKADQNTVDVFFHDLDSLDIEDINKVQEYIKLLKQQAEERKNLLNKNK